MALTITITNPRTIAIIEQQAAQRGVSAAAIVDDVFSTGSDAAVPAAHPLTSEERAARHRRIDGLIKQIAAAMDPRLSREQIDDVLYDEYGLPR